MRALSSLPRSHGCILGWRSPIAITCGTQLLNSLMLDADIDRADFEALGVNASVAISQRASPSAPFKHLFAFESIDAGLEYGYRGGNF